MKYKQNLGLGFTALFETRHSQITVYNGTNQILTTVSPAEIIRDAGIFYRTQRPSLREWFRSLYKDENEHARYYLPSQGRKMYKFRYYVKIGCTEFTYSQLDKLIKFAIKYNDI